MTTTGPISELDRTSLVNKGFLLSKPFIAETTREISRVKMNSSLPFGKLIRTSS